AECVQAPGRPGRGRNSRPAKAGEQRLLPDRRWGRVRGLRGGLWPPRAAAAWPERARAGSGSLMRHRPVERVAFALAGSLTLLAVPLGVVVSRGFLLRSSFVGLNQWLYVATGACPASLGLERAGVERRCMG